MARKPRIKSESQSYHVILRGNNRQSIFLDDNDRVFMLKRLRKYSADTHIEIYAYCLMDNHIHILIGKANPNLSRFIQKLATSYAMYFNRKYDRCGHLFQGRFKSEPVESEIYFKTVLRYILQNPCKANICSINQYKWSSYQSIFKTKNSDFINTQFIVTLFKNKQVLEKFLFSTNTDICMEYENKTFISDSVCFEIIMRTLNLKNSSEILSLKKQDLLPFVTKLKKSGINISQLSRITGIPRNKIDLA